MSDAETVLINKKAGASAFEAGDYNAALVHYTSELWRGNNTHKIVAKWMQVHTAVHSIEQHTPVVPYNTV